MRAHLTTLQARVRRAGLRVQLRFRVVAVGLDSRGRFIGIATNSPRLPNRSYHAEEVLMHRSPLSLSKILLARVGKTGLWLPIDPCERCARLAQKRGVIIERLVEET